MPIVTEAKSVTENLCDTCKLSIPTCEPDKGILEFGKGVGHDNVIVCDAYKEDN